MLSITADKELTFLMLDYYTEKYPLKWAHSGLAGVNFSRYYTSLQTIIMPSIYSPEFAQPSDYSPPLSDEAVFVDGPDLTPAKTADLRWHSSPPVAHNTMFVSTYRMLAYYVLQHPLKYVPVRAADAHFSGYFNKD